MRKQMAAIGCGVTMIAAGAVPVAVAREAHASSGLPKVIVGSYSGIEPTGVFFSGDGGNIVLELKWRWGTQSATGHGTSVIQNCIPNCAAGKNTPVATTIVFSKPVNGHFTKVVETRRGEKVVGYYGRPSWPEGAK